MNVLAVEREKLNILRKSNFDGQRTINLLLIANNEKKHYAAIKTSYSRCAYGEVKDPLQLYWDKDCVEVFCKHIKEKAKRLYHMFPEMPMKRLTQEEWREFNPIRTWGDLPPGSRFFANNFGNNKGIQSKLGDFS